MPSAVSERLRYTPTNSRIMHVGTEIGECTRRKSVDVRGLCGDLRRIAKHFRNTMRA